MNKRFLIIILILLVLLAAACSSNAPTAGASTAQQPTTEKNKEVKGESITKEIEAKALSNNILQEPLKQGISIYLPGSYESGSKRYPVLYFLPGYEDDYRSYGIVFERAMNSLVSENKAKEMIIVCVNGCNRFGGSFYFNSPVTGNWEDFVTTDVVNYVDKNYRTIKTPEARGLAGHSMGGFGVINIAMHHPEIFSYIYSMSPGLFDPKGLEKCSVRFDYLKKADNQTLEEYLELISTLRWPENFTYAYGSTFAPASAEEGSAHFKPPFIKMPKIKASGEIIHDEIWKLWESGYGGWEDKVMSNKENFLKLKGFVIEYGTKDGYAWIPEGCIYFSDLLKQGNIKHELITYEGDHQSQVNKRIKTDVIPYFSECLATE